MTHRRPQDGGSQKRQPVNKHSIASAFRRVWIAIRKGVASLWQTAVPPPPPLPRPLPGQFPSLTSVRRELLGIGTSDQADVRFTVAPPAVPPLDQRPAEGRRYVGH